MAITLTTFDTSAHEVTFNLGNGKEVTFRHVSDIEISDLRLFSPAQENTNDATALPADRGL